MKETVATEGGYLRGPFATSFSAKLVRIPVRSGTSLKKELFTVLTQAVAKLVPYLRHPDP